MVTRRKGRGVIYLMTCIALCAVLVFSGLNFPGPISAENIYEYVEENEPEVADDSEVVIHEEPYRRFDERYGLMDDRFGTWDKTTPFEKAIPQRNEGRSFLDELLPLGDYEVREPIRIDSDENFTEQADTEGWPGNGTEGNPYIIEGYEIDGTGHGYCIFIGNTTVHFELRDNYLHNASGKSSVRYFRDAGIYLHNAANALIEDNTALNNHNGIYFHFSKGNAIVGNIASLNTNGIYIRHVSYYNIITDNIVSSNDNGIRLNDCNRWNVLDNNTVVNNNDRGIRISYHSDYNTFTNNTIYNSNYGIEIRSFSTENTFTNNTIYSHRRGFYIRDSGSQTITNNKISENGVGIWFYLYSSNNIIKGNKISNNYAEGIRLVASHGNIVSDNIVSNTRLGIYLWVSNNNELSNNTVSGCGWAVLLRDTNNNALSKNTVSNNNHGIILYISTNQTLTDNVMENNGLFIDGNTSHQWNTHIIDTSNTVNGKPVYYWKDRTGGTVPADAGHVILASCTNILVENFIFNNSDVGIQLGFSNNNFIINNTASHNGYDGICLFRSHGNVITDNTVSNNGWMGIFLWRSDGNIISGNTASHNDHGILVLDNSDENTFTDNTVSNSRRMGFYLSTSNGNNITNNHIFSNNGMGIHLRTSSDGNTLLGNVLENDGVVITGWASEHWNTHSIDDSNTANGKPIYYWKDRTSGTVPEGAGQVILANCTGVTIKNQNISDVHTGVLIGFSDNNIITNNTLTNNYFGVLFRLSDGNTITNNTLTNNNDGIFFRFSDGNTITNNTLTNNNYGIFFRSSENNLIYRNRFVENVYQGYDDGNNDWDYGDPVAGGKGGNYWSDYEGNDRGDGIGDVPYYLSYGNRDKFPWVSYQITEVTYIEIAPKPTNITAGDTHTFSAFAYDANHNLIGEVSEISGFGWSMEAGAGGNWYRNIYFSEFAGTWTVTGTYSTIMDTATLTINPGDAGHIVISPDESNINAGDTQDFTVTAYDEFNNEIGYVTDETTWSIETDAGGIWDDNVYTSESAGTWTVTVTYNGLTDDATLIVESEGIAYYLKIRPETAYTKAGDSITYTAVIYDQYWNEIDEVTDQTNWSIEARAGGNWTDSVYTSEFSGIWTVSGVYDGITGEANLTVNPGNVSYMAISPQVFVINAGQTRAFTADTYDQFGNMINDVTGDTNWSIEGGAGGSWLNNAYNSEFSGTWTVSGMHNDLTDNATLTVNPSIVHTVIISPSEEQYVNASQNIVFTAAAYDVYGNLISDESTDFIWQNACEDGVFYQERPGVYRVTATYEGVTSDSTTVTVETSQSSYWWLLLPLVAVVIVLFVLLKKWPLHEQEEPAVKGLNEPSGK